MTTQEPFQERPARPAAQARAREGLEWGDGPRCRCGRPVDRAFLPAAGAVRVCMSGLHVMVGVGDAMLTYVYVENPEDVIVTAGHADTCARRQIGTVGPDPECDCWVGDA